MKWAGIFSLLALATVAQGESVRDSSGVSASGAERQLNKKPKHHGVGVPVPVVPAPVNVAVVMPPPPPPPPAPIISCPPEYSLIDKQCVMTEVVPPSTICPSGTEMIGGRCQQFTRPRRECPVGFQLSGARCVASEVLPVEFTCPEGILDETGTACKVSQALGAQCPPGYQLDAEAGDCVQTFGATTRCEEGYMKGKHGCTTSHKQRALLVCPEGSELDKMGHKCFVLKKPRARCPHGFMLSSKSARCLKKVKKSLAPCPPGFDEFSHHKAICERMLTQPPHLACPDGSILDQSTGQCVSKMPPPLTCPPGFNLADGGATPVCEKVVEEIANCPPGTQQIGFGPTMKCQASIDHEIIECCPPGFEMSFGKCRRVDLMPSACGDGCFAVTAVPPQYHCPEGYSVSGNMCQAIEPVSPCGPDMGFGDSGSLRSASEQIPSHCLPPPMPYPHTLPADAVCPPESSFDGKMCVIQQPLPREQMCTTGVFDPTTGRCKREIIVPIKSECPLGTTRVGKRCVEYEDHRPEFTCPEGSDRNAQGLCVIRDHAVSGTAPMFATAPMPICPSGKLEGELCRTYERVPRQMVCPINTVPAQGIDEIQTDDGHHEKYCIEFAPIETGTPMKKYLKPRFVCPDGEPAKGKHCYSKDLATPSYICPEGTERRGSICLRRMNPITGGLQTLTTVAIPICPAGTIVSGNRCIATKEVEPLTTCPPGFIQQPGAPLDQACARFAETVMVCPPDTLQTADGCLRERVVPPMIDAPPPPAPVDPCETSVCD